MIKTLRITSIIAVVLAAVLFVFPAVFGIRHDKEAEQFLKSPGVIEQFSKAEGQKKIKDEKEDSPLVKQAEAFALYLNPPKPVEPTVPLPAVAGAPRPKTISPKFDLIGTSFYSSNPQLSLALIDEPGKGLRWVRQSSEVGHLIIEQVKDGAIVVRDGQQTFELVAERPERTNLVKRTLPISTDISPTNTTTGEPPPTTQAIEPQPETNITTVEQPPPPPVEIKPEEMLSKLMAMKAAVESDVNNPEHAGIEGEMLDKLISEYKAMRITDQEAKRLEQLGEDLNDIRLQDPNLAEGKEAESDANSSEANTTQ